MDCKWNSSPFNPTPISWPNPHLILLGHSVYKRMGHSVLQVSLVRPCVLATLKLNPSYLCKARGFISVAVMSLP